MKGKMVSSIKNKLSLKKIALLSIIAIEIIIIFSLVLPQIIPQFDTQLLNNSENQKPNIKVSKEHPNVLLITFDALRADHLPCYGYERNTAPNVCEFAEKNIKFENAYAQAPYSLPSYTSIYTGLYPPNHGMLKHRSKKLPKNITTLAEILSKNGYETRAYVDAGPLDHLWGMDQGFDYFNDDFNYDDGIANTSEMVEKSIDWLGSRNKDKPFLLHMAFLDPHFPYRATNKTILNKFDPKYTGSIDLNEERVGQGKLAEYSKNISEEDEERLIAGYDTSIFVTDKHIGKLLQFLEEKNLKDQTIILITSDHGEGLRDHEATIGRNYYTGWVAHTYQLYEESIKVPLIAKFPGVNNKTIEERVELVDISPTLTSTIKDLNYIPKFDGDNLKKLIRRRSSYFSEDKEKVFSFTSFAKYSKIKKYAIIDNNYKLIWDKQDNNSKLFYLPEDPKEKNDLSQEKPELVNKLKSQIKERFGNTREIGERNLNKEMKNILENLGYIRNDE